MKNVWILKIYKSESGLRLGEYINGYPLLLYLPDIANFMDMPRGVGIQLEEILAYLERPWPKDSKSAKTSSKLDGYPK